MARIVHCFLPYTSPIQLPIHFPHTFLYFFNAGPGRVRTQIRQSGRFDW